MIWMVASTPMWLAGALLMVMAVTLLYARITSHPAAEKLDNSDAGFGALAMLGAAAVCFYIAARIAS